MATIINEWQLDCRLNKALNHQHRADFALWLAFLSPAVEEMAEFQTPQLNLPQDQKDLYATLSVKKVRGYGWEEQDLATLTQHSEAVNTGSLRQLKLQQYLANGPLVLADDMTKLPSEVLQNLDAHSQRRLNSGKVNRTDADPTALYDILQQLHQHDAA